MQIESATGHRINQILPDRDFFNYSSFLGDHVFAVLSKISADIGAYEFALHHQYFENHIFNFGGKERPLIYPEQVHSDRVVFSDDSGYFRGCDGIVTANRKLVIRIKVADCVPVFLHDPVKRVNGLIHSGWRGTVKRITTKGISKFMETGSRIQDLTIVLGPSIKMRNYIVQKDVASYFGDQHKKKISGGWKIDLIGEIIEELICCGIQEHHIFSTDICTVESKDCHSYRRDGDKAGRMYAYMGHV